MSELERRRELANMSKVELIGYVIDLEDGLDCVSELLERAQ